MSAADAVPLPLAEAARAIGCVVDMRVYDTLQVGKEVAVEFVKAAAGLYVTTERWRLSDAEHARILGPKAMPGPKFFHPALLAEADQVRAECMDTLRELKPRLIELGVLKEEAPS